MALKNVLPALFGSALFFEKSVCCDVKWKPMIHTGPENLSLKVPNIEVEFDVSAHSLTSNAVISKNKTCAYNSMQMSNSI